MIMNAGRSERLRSVTLPLLMAGRGKAWRVAGLAGTDEHRRRLSELGFVEGRSVEVLQEDGAGSLVVRIGEARLAMTRGLALQVKVR